MLIFLITKMFKSKYLSLLKYNKFIFGEQIVSQFVLFEYKKLFSIIFFYFHKSNGTQDRFHTHAFNALSIKLFGKYTEYVLIDEITGEYIKKERNKIFKYFKKDSYHKIGNSTGCFTILLSGKWDNSWKEFITTNNKNIINTYSIGRIIK